MSYKLILNQTFEKLRREAAFLNNAMHTKPDLRVVLKWMIYRSGSVIADVIGHNDGCRNQ